MAVDITVDPARCNASASCLRLAPGVFHIDRGLALVIDEEAAPESAIVTAARECPTGAITVSKGGRRLA